jgi:hypothetical protein
MGEYGINTFNLFLNFKVAYESIDRTQLFKVMEKLKITRKI